MSGDTELSRRDLLRGRLRGALAPGDAPPARDPFRQTIPVHRPPGAVDEKTFLSECTRCDACLEACPHDAIVHAPIRFREAAGTPMIDPAHAPCRMCEGTPCIPACEPRVLRADLPLAMATVMIVDQTCLAHQGTTCTVCSEHCPVDGAITLESGRPRIDPGTCTGCGVCHYVCPAPANAVIVMPLAHRPPPPPAATEIPFPPMSDAMLGAAEIDRLFCDLRDHATVLEVRLKGAARGMVGAAAHTLDDAERAVRERSARGVQVRYAWDGAQWLDTLMLLDGGVRLIRVQHGPAA